MKKTILIAAVLLVACATTGGEAEKTATVYEPAGPNDQGTLPNYRIRQQPDGSMEVFKYGDPFTPAYIIRGDRIYQPENKFEPVGQVRDGLPFTDKRGK